jgi:hypothetical protein
MRLKQYINEGRSVSITELKALKYIKMHCMNAWFGHKIYRGNRKLDDDYYLLDASTYDERTSPFADNNFYNLLLSNLPSWKKYPKRNKSVICTTSSHNAENRGNGTYYYVLPVDNAIIGVCPAGDIWDSFYASDIDLGTFSSDLEIFLYDQVSKSARDTDRDYDEFVSVCEKADRLKKEEELNIDEVSAWLEKYIMSPLPLIEYLDKILSPKKNKFKLVKSGHDLYDNREVWTDAKCILVKDISRLGALLSNDGDIEDFEY